MNEDRRVGQVRQQMRVMSGRAYAIALEKLDAKSLDELQAFLRDVKYDHQAEVTRARRHPWRM